MKFSILSQQTVIGVLPYSALLSGSADLGDVLNSWITYSNKAMAQMPTHAIAVLNKVVPTMVNSAAALADSFRLEAAPEPIQNDGIITFKGVEYYVIDFNAEDDVIDLSGIKKTVVDASSAKEADEIVQLDNLDLLFAFVTGQVSTALNNAVFSKQTAGGPVAVASPALPQAPGSGLYKAQPYPAIEASRGQSVIKSSRGVDIDVAAAQTALSALLQKGSL